MKKCPEIGRRVKYRGGPSVGICTGIVTKIYPTEEWDDVEDKPTGSCGQKQQTAVDWEYPCDLGSKVREIIKNRLRADASYIVDKRLAQRKD